MKILLVCSSVFQKKGEWYEPCVFQTLSPIYNSTSNVFFISRVRPRVFFIVTRIVPPPLPPVHDIAGSLNFFRISSALLPLPRRRDLPVSSDFPGKLNPTNWYNTGLPLMVNTRSFPRFPVSTSGNILGFSLLSCSSVYRPSTPYSVPRCRLRLTPLGI